jgi:fused signal recognition particle receptor
MFKRLRDGLLKTSKRLAGRIKDTVLGRAIDDDLLDEIEEILLTSDVGVKASTALIEDLREAYEDRRITTGEEVVPYLKENLTTLLAGAGAELRQADSPPTVILVAGVNGSGKTTSIAKLSRLLAAEGKKVVLAACDTFRAAAVEQLTIWSERTGVDIVKQPTGADPASVAWDAAEAAVARKADYLIVDTAGRLHTQTNLMKELEKIHRVLKKRLPEAPHEVIQVLDATSGQNAIQQVRLFDECIQVTGLFLAKLDGTAKGGVIIGIRHEIDVPVKFVGVGEKPDDIERFDAAQFVEALFA